MAESALPFMDRFTEALEARGLPVDLVLEAVWEAAGLAAPEARTRDN